MYARFNGCFVAISGLALTVRSWPFSELPTVRSSAGIAGWHRAQAL